MVCWYVHQHRIISKCIVQENLYRTFDVKGTLPCIHTVYEVDISYITCVCCHITAETETYTRAAERNIIYLCRQANAISGFLFMP